MQNLMVVIDGSEQGWQAAFLAYDLAVRGGIRLIGAVPAAIEDGDLSRRLLVEFRTGARAAGVRFGTSRPKLIDGALSAEDRTGVTGLLLGRSRLERPEQLAALAASAPFPFWIVPAFREVKRAVVIHDLRPSPRLIEVANAAARTWNWAIEEWWLGTDSPSLPSASSLSGPIHVDPQQLLHQAASLPGDVCVVAWPPLGVPVWDLLTRLDRPLLIVPAP